MDGNNFIYKIVFRNQVIEMELPSDVTVEQLQRRIVEELRVGRQADIQFMSLTHMYLNCPASDLPRDSEGRRWIRVCSDNVSRSPGGIDEIILADAAENMALSVNFIIPPLGEHRMIVRNQDSVADVTASLINACDIIDIRKMTIRGCGSSYISGNLLANRQALLIDSGLSTSNNEIDVEASVKVQVRITIPTKDAEIVREFPCYPSDGAGALLNAIRQSQLDFPMENETLLYEYGCCANSFSQNEELLFETGNSVFASSSSGIGHSGNIQNGSYFIRPLNDRSSITYFDKYVSQVKLYTQVKYYFYNDRGELEISTEANIWSSVRYCVAVEGIEVTSGDEASPPHRFFNTMIGWQKVNDEKKFTSKQELIDSCNIIHASVFHFFIFCKDGDSLPKLSKSSLSLSVPIDLKPHLNIDKGARVFCQCSEPQSDRWLCKQDATFFKQKKKGFRKSFLRKGKK